MDKLDLNGLANEISQRKKTTNTAIGGTTHRNQFLFGLMKAVNENTITQSTELIKHVDNATALREGTTPKLKPAAEIPSTQPVAPAPRRTVTGISNDEIEREELMYNQIGNRYNPNRPPMPQQLNSMPQQGGKTLAESMEEFAAKNPGYQYPPQTAGYPYPVQTPGYQYPQQPTMLNEQVIVNQIAPIVNEMFNRNLMEIYAVDMIKKVISENPKMLKEMVIEVIREIQQKNKK